MYAAFLAFTFIVGALLAVMAFGDWLRDGGRQLDRLVDEALTDEQVDER